jgi:hypothetical protein
MEWSEKNLECNTTTIFQFYISQDAQQYTRGMATRSTYLPCQMIDATKKPRTLHCSPPLRQNESQAWYESPIQLFDSHRCGSQIDIRVGVSPNGLGAATAETAGAITEGRHCVGGVDARARAWNCVSVEATMRACKPVRFHQRREAPPARAVKLRWRQCEK